MKFIYSKAFLGFAILLTAVALLLFFDSKGYLDPVRYAILNIPRPFIAVTERVVNPIQVFFKTLYTLKNIVKENGLLAARINDLQQRLILFDQYQQENEILRQELGFISKSSYNLTPCSVLAIDPQGITDTMILGCGEAQGIKDGQAVLSQGYLVGTIIHTGSLTSTALLITNTNSSVDGKISSQKTEGVIKGSFGSGILFDLIPQNNSLNKGDLVVTAGIGSVVPKNILIGEIGETLSKPNDLFKKASIVSPIKFHDVEFTFVATPL